MNRTPRALALVFVAGMAFPCLGQDSVSNSPFSGQGDALSPYDTTEQCNRYVVKLAPLTTSWGTGFGVAPIIKLSRGNPSFYTSLGSAVSISNTLATRVPFDPTGYLTWSSAGQGVNAARNTPPASVTGPRFDSAQFAVAVNEFESGPNGTTTAYYDGVVGAVVNYDPANPGELYVNRVLAASNGNSPTEENSSLGLGSVDNAGNTHFRADPFQLNGSNPITLNNYFRVAMAARNCGVVNVIDGSSSSDGSVTWIDLDPINPGRGSSVNHTTPGIIAADLAGRPVVGGANFATIGEYVYESSPGTTSTSIGTRPPSYINTRGGAVFSSVAHFPGSVATGGMLAYDPTIPGSTSADTMVIWGVDNNGAPVGNMALPIRDPFTGLPTTIIDNSDGFDPAAQYGPLWIDELGNFRSQVAFQGGNGQVAIGQDQNGDTLVAAQVQFLGSFTGQRNPDNGIIVTKIPVGGGAPTSTLAAYNAPGKKILDGPGGNAVGRLARMCEVTQRNHPSGLAPCDPGIPLPGAPNGVERGPSISSPMFDSVGNIWFVSAVELFRTGQPSDFDTALIRAVYSPATFSYELELVMQLGDVFQGQNSGTRYQVTFLELIDSDSISSGAPFSSAINQSAAHGQSTGGLSPADPATLGGLVLNARIVYDTDGIPGFSSATDENYRVVLYVGDTGSSGCYADCDTSTGLGVLDIFDFLCFQNEFAAGAPYACECDTSTGTGVCDIFDFLCFQNAFAGGCP